MADRFLRHGLSWNHVALGTQNRHVETGTLKPALVKCTCVLDTGVVSVLGVRCMVTYNFLRLKTFLGNRSVLDVSTF